MIDALIEATLNTLGVPVSRQFTEQKDVQYIVLQPIATVPDGHADDDYQLQNHTLRVHIFSKGNYQALLAAAVQALKSAGFTLNSIDGEIYEEVTGYFQRPITIQFMEEI